MQSPTPGSDTHRVSSSHTESAAYSPALAVTPRTPGSDYSAKSNDEDEGDVEKDLADGIRKLSINLNPYRYHGKSSGLVFIRSALELKTEMTGPKPQQKPDADRPSVSATQIFARYKGHNRLGSGCRSPWKTTCPCSTRAGFHPKI